MPPRFYPFFWIFHYSQFWNIGNKIGVCVLVAQLCPTLCNPIDGSPPGSPVHGILQARTLEWVTISFSKRNYRKKESEVAQSCPTLYDPMDCSLPGSPIHGILQARVLECVTISFSKIGMNILKKKKYSFPDLYQYCLTPFGNFLKDPS